LFDLLEPEDVVPEFARDCFSGHHGASERVVMMVAHTRFAMGRLSDSGRGPRVSDDVNSDFEAIASGLPHEGLRAFTSASTARALRRQISQTP